MITQESVAMAAIVGTTVGAVTGVASYALGQYAQTGLAFENMDGAVGRFVLNGFINGPALSRTISSIYSVGQMVYDNANKIGLLF